jgi:hypothetical protein
MPSLAEAQTWLRKTIVEECADVALPLLVGGQDPAKRLAVHQRHFEASLTSALLGKFPATSWLIGSMVITEATRAFVHRHLPAVPCIAEYGSDFPQFLAHCVGAERVPYLYSFAELEWHLGHAAIAVDHPALTIDAFAMIEADELVDLRLKLQPGLRYCAAAWPVDDLIRLYLSDAAPERHEFESADVHLEICGARGEFRIERLDVASFAFRKALAERQTIEMAAEQALEREANFDPGRALTAFIAETRVVAMISSEERAHDGH